MQIAPKTHSDEWKTLTFKHEDDWAKAIGIFEGRIRGRFTNAIDVLVADDEKKSAWDRRWGFTILAIDCLLVETLQAFREGRTDTDGVSRALSVRFLTTQPAFKPFFPTEDIASRFYYEFRCGLAHNGQVFGNGRIWSIGRLLSVNPATRQIIVNRTAFHKSLIQEIDSYVEELKDQKNAVLRQKFRDKMDFIATEQFVIKKPRVKKR